MPSGHPNLSKGMLFNWNRVCSLNSAEEKEIFGIRACCPKWASQAKMACPWRNESGNRQNKTKRIRIRYDKVTFAPVCAWDMSGQFFQFFPLVNLEATS